MTEAERALAAVEAAARGDEALARAELKLLGESPWALAVRGALRARWGELDEALRDLSVALKRERVPWIVAARADVLNRLGRYPEALRDLRSLARLMPGRAEPWALAAGVQLDQALYPEAAESLGRALAANPRDPELWRRRAHAYFVQGDLPRARADAARAARLAPRDAGIAREALRLKILSGGGAVLPRGLSAGEAAYWRGYRLCRRGRRVEAQAAFLRAAKDPGWAPRAVFYERAARILAARPPVPPPAGRELVIMGLGYKQPFQVSLETLSVMDSCSLLFSNLSDPAVAEFLGLFPAKATTIVFRRHDYQSTACAREVMEAFRRGPARMRVGMVTRGNPLFYGRLAYRLVRDCRRLGIACRVLSSVSISDTFPALVPHAAPGGLEVRDSSSLRAWDARLPLIVYNPPVDGTGGERLSILKSQCPPDHPLQLLPGSGDREFSPKRTPLHGLARALEEADPAVTLLVPPARRP